jgi:ribosomal protein L7/L12
MSGSRNDNPCDGQSSSSPRQFVGASIIPDDGTHLNDLQALLAEGRKIEAIKRYREATGADLATAKEVVESLERAQSPVADKPSDSELDNEIASLLASGRKIEAIKVYRRHTGAGLKEAKDAVEAIAKGRNIAVPSGSGCLGVLLLLVVIAISAVVRW